MTLKHLELAGRAQAMSANGELFPLATGQESVEELRNLCLQLTKQCPCGEGLPACPFRRISGLPQDTVKDVLASMEETELRELFVLELGCRTAALKNRPANRRPRMIWLEDDVLLCELLAEMTRDRFQGAELIFFNNGNEAWKELSKRQPDVFLTDQQHPGMKGTEILRKLAKTGAKYPIVWSSADVDEEIQKKITSLGLNLSFLAKPFSAEDYNCVLDRLLGDASRTALPCGEFRKN